MESTPTSQQTSIARNYFMATMNENTFDESVLCNDYVAHMGTDSVASLSDIKSNIGAMHEAVSDIELTVEDTIADGDDVVLRWRLRGTHDSGPFMGVEPTGKAFSLVGFIQFRFENGVIAEAWNLSDAVAFLRDTGALHIRED